tara:strand:- start:107 stop:1213 length:1107 start_codon:yes stop_codon:yes gene_type:complete
MRGKQFLSRFQNSLLFILSFTFSLTICEFLVRKFYPQPVGGNFRTFSKNNDYFVNIPNKKTFSRFTNYSTFYNTDSNGWRGGVLNDEAKFRIAFLGDSFTFGLYLDEEDSYPYQFYSNLNNEDKNLQSNLAIINAAIPASGISEMLAYLQDYGDTLDSDVIVLGINYSTFSRGYKNALYDINCFDNRAIRSNIISSRSKGYDVISSLLRDNFFTNNSELYYLTRLSISQLREKFFGRKVSIPLKYADLNKKDVLCFAKTYLKEIKSVSEKFGSKLLVLNLGFQETDPNFYSQSMMRISPDSIILKNLESLTAELDLDYIDASSFIRQSIKENELILIPFDGHPTSIGNNQVSKALQKNLVPFLKKIIN